MIDFPCFLCAEVVTLAFALALIVFSKGFKRLTTNTIYMPVGMDEIHPFLAAITAWLFWQNLARLINKIVGFRPVLICNGDNDPGIVVGDKLYKGKRYIICLAELSDENPVARRLRRNLSLLGYMKGIEVRSGEC